MFCASTQHTEILWNSTNSYSDRKQNQSGMWPLSFLKTANNEIKRKFTSHTPIILILDINDNWNPCYSERY